MKRPGQLVRDRLALHGLVQVDVLDRHRRLVGEVGEQLALARREAAVAAGDGDDADRPPPSSPPPSGAASALAPAELDLGDLPRVERRRLGRVQRAVVGLRIARERDLAQPLLARAADRGAPAGGADAVDRRLDDDLQQAHPVQALGERLADPADRLLQPRALALQLLEARLELVRHRVELLAQLRELVVALDRDLDGEVAPPDVARGEQEPLDLVLQRARDRDREGDGEDEEAEQRAEHGQRGAGDSESSPLSGSTMRIVRRGPSNDSIGNALTR